MKFRAKLLQVGKSGTGLQVPDQIVAALGAGKRPPVRVTINGHTFRTIVTAKQGKFMVEVTATVRKTTGVGVEDLLDVQIESA